MTQNNCSVFAQFCFRRSKQPHFRVLAAQCVRGLLFPSRDLREGVERWEAPGCLRSTLGGGVNVPTSHGKAPCAPKARRSASQRSTNHRAVDRSGIPVQPALALSAERIASRKQPLIEQDGSDNKPALGGVDKECEKFFS